MTRPWLLIACTGVTIGAFLGWPGAVLFAVAGGVVAASGRQRPRLLVLVAFGFALVGVIRVATWQPPGVDQSITDSVQAEGVVRDVPQIGPSGPRAVVRVERIQHPSESWAPASADVLVFFGDSAPHGIQHGDQVRVRWFATSLQQTEPDFKRFVTSENAGAYAWAFSTSIQARGDSATNILVRLRNTVTDRIEAVVDGDAGSLLAGFVTGDDSGMSSDARRAFELTNTSHITAVSGSNVAVLVAMWSVLVPTRRMQRSLLVQLLLLAMIWSYVVLVGLSPSAVRAGLFATLMLPAPRFGRKADPMTALMLASAVMLLLSPALSRNVGFWLSMAASTALVTTLQLRDATLLGVVKRALLSLIAAQVATFPMVLLVFDGWSPASVVSNLIVGPLVSLMFPFAFCFALAVALAPWIGTLIGWMPELGANTIIAVIQSLAGEFPMLRSGPVSAGPVVLVAAFSIAVIAAVSVDVRRWSVRVEAAQWAHRSIVGACMVGASIGVWIAAVALVIVR